MELNRFTSDEVAKDINTNSKEWCDIVFESKNKSYGAYKMRQTSSKRHIISFLVILLLFAFFAYLPTFIELVEFYVFQRTQSDYIVEDYKYITESLTEVELQQLQKQYIPNQAKSQVKSIKSHQQVQNVQDIKSQIPIIVDGSLLDDQYPEDLQTDTTLDESENKQTEEMESNTDDGLYLVVEEMAAFPGGEPGLMDYIYKNLRYPYTAANNKIENCVICTFIIDANGAVTQVEVIQSAHPLLDKEALRVVKSLPKWKPAKQHGRFIKVKYTLPIIFRLK